MPPSHCKKALHIKIPFGSDSKLLSVVAPVVVTPLIDSNKASTIPKFTSVYKKGTAHRKVINIQDNTVITKAYFNVIFKSTFLFVITSEPPTIKYNNIGTAYDCQT